MCPDDVAHRRARDSRLRRRRRPDQVASPNMAEDGAPTVPQPSFLQFSRLVTSWPSTRAGIELYDLVCALPSITMLRGDGRLGLPVSGPVGALRRLHPRTDPDRGRRAGPGPTSWSRKRPGARRRPLGASGSIGLVDVGSGGQASMWQQTVRGAPGMRRCSDTGQRPALASAVTFARTSSPLALGQCHLPVAMRSRHSRRAG